MGGGLHPDGTLCPGTAYPPGTDGCAVSTA